MKIAQKKAIGQDFEKFRQLLKERENKLIRLLDEICNKREGEIKNKLNY